MHAVPPEIPDTEIARARREGRRQAEEFDAALSAVERREREELLTRIAWRAGDLLEPAGGASSSQLARLERQLEYFSSFHHAVLHSRGWRLLQTLRRLVGRAW